MKPREFKIDASVKPLGRLASDVATLLREKDTAQFDPSKISTTRVVVFNTDRVRVSGRKETQKLYHRHSGFLGSLKSQTLKMRRAGDSRGIVRDAVLGMLPKNKLRKRIIQHLVLLKGEQ